MACFWAESAILAKLNHNSRVVKKGRAFWLPCRKLTRYSWAWVSAAGSPNASSKVASKASQVPQSSSSLNSPCLLLAHILASFDPQIHDRAKAIFRWSEGNWEGFPIMYKSIVSFQARNSAFLPVNSRFLVLSLVETSLCVSDIFVLRMIVGRGFDWKGGESSLEVDGRGLVLISSGEAEGVAGLEIDLALAGAFDRDLARAVRSSDDSEDMLD